VDLKAIVVQGNVELIFIKAKSVLEETKARELLELGIRANENGYSQELLGKLREEMIEEYDRRIFSQQFEKEMETELLDEDNRKR
jgi:hypothetical protein